MNENLRNVIDVDRIIHEPSRLVIVAILYTVESTDFLYLLKETGLTKGNLSSHLSRLEKAGYINIEKTFEGKVTRTICSLTKRGREAFDEYRLKLDAVINN